MSKNILIKFLVILLVIVLSHSVFWFFKTGQLEKHVNNFVAENNGNISIGEVKVTGFPFSQKVIITDLKFSIPNPAFNKYQVVVKSAEAVSGIFSNNFTVNLLDKVTIQDAEGNVGNVEFAQNPQINFVVEGGIVSNFSYVDSGYKVFDIDKNIIYASVSSSVSFVASVESNDQITVKLNADIKEMEGFTLLDIYKNSSEKKIIDGIKTGEIVLGGAATIVAGDPNSQPSAAISPQPPVVASAASAGVVTDPIALAKAAATGATTDTAVANIPNDAAAIASALASNNIIKNNLVVNFEYILTPNKNEQQAALPFDPAQMQESPTQYSRAIKVNHLEFSNSLYKIIINGQVNSFQDDNLPSGFITIKVENSAALLSYLSSGFAQIAEQKKASPEVQQSSDLSTQSSAQGGAYQDFLKRIASGISSVSTELAAKNQLTKDNIAVFDMRREKNLEFVINETPLREVLGKF